MTQRVVFQGLDTGDNENLWVTDGTATGTTEILPAGASSGGLFPSYLIAYNGKVLFQGNDANGHGGLWVTDGTTTGTTEILPADASATFRPIDFTVYNGKVLFEGVDASGNFSLWVTDGTATGTTEILPTSGAISGLDPTNLTVSNGKVLFAGYDSSNDQQLWVTDGTATGTTKILPAGAGTYGLAPANLAASNGKVLFQGADATDDYALWETDGTAAGTTEILPSSGNSYGIAPSNFFAYNGKTLFSGTDINNHQNLFVSDGTSAGTSEILPSSGVYSYGLAPSNFTLYNGKVLFEGAGPGDTQNLWVTDGTLAGTTEILPTGVSLGFGLSPEYITAYNGKALFRGYDAATNPNLWVTDGTATGTTEILPSGASSYGLNPSYFTAYNGKLLFLGYDSSNHSGLWMTDGTAAGTTEILPSGVSSTSGLNPSAFALLGLPYLSGVQATPSVAGPLGTGRTISFTLTPSAAVTVSTTGGNPTLTLDDGASAAYTGQDSNGNLLFSLTVASGEDTADLHVTALALNGSTITDASSQALDASALGALAGADTGLTIDTTPPAAPVITSADLTDMATPVITGTADAGSTVTLTIGGATYTATTGSGGAWSINLASPPSSGSLSLDTNGSNAITATATDTAGNMSGSATQALTIDTTLPDAPAITSPALTDSAAPVITGTAEAGSTVTLMVDGQSYTTVATGGVWSVDLATATPTSGILLLNLNGINEVGATATDPAGNQSSTTGQALTIDTTLPAAPAGLALAAGSDSGVPGDGLTNVITPTITGTGETGDTLTLYDGDVAIGTATVSNGAWSVTPSMALIAGSHSLTARQTDPAGNVSVTSSVLPLTIDTTLPAAPSSLALAAGSDSGVVGDGITSATSPVIGGTGMAGDTVKLYDGTTLLGTTTVAAGGAWSFTPASPLANGVHSLTTTQTSSAGNVSAASAPFALTIETGTPNVTAMLAANPHNTASATYNQVLDGGGDANASVTISDGGAVIGTVVADATGAWSFDLAGLAAGNHSLVASEANAAGTTGVSAAVPLTVAAAVVPDTRFSVATGSTATSGKFFGSDYSGPLPGLQAQYGYVGTDNVNVVANVANTFIYSGTAGEDALVANSGSNVLDSRGGSDWMIGASGADGGTDTFFVDSRTSGSPTTWDTALNFHAGDKLTIWDFSPTAGSMSFTDNLGQPGYTGTTLQAHLGNGATDLVTFAGLSGGASHFAASTGTSGGLGYLAVTRTS